MSHGHIISFSFVHCMKISVEELRHQLENYKIRNLIIKDLSIKCLKTEIHVSWDTFD